MPLANARSPGGRFVPASCHFASTIRLMLRQDVTAKKRKAYLPDGVYNQPRNRRLSCWIDDMNAKKVPDTFLEDLRDCGRYFHDRGWSVGTSSNYSAVMGRNPLELIVTASGADKGRLNQGDFVRVDSTGVATTVGQLKSSAETALHVVLAELPETGAVLHTHSVWGTLLSDYHFPERGFWIEGYEMLKGLAGIRTHESRLWVPIFDNTQDIPFLADEVRQRLTNRSQEISHGFLIRNHGLYTWGNDIASARRHVEIFEFLFEVIGRKTDFSR